MITALLRWFAPLLVAAACLLPVSAQTPPMQPTPAPGNPEATERTAPVLQTAVAFICTIIVMVILCKPSRKG
jgi:hypothetical protein